jgi:hypothetical protein
LLGFLRWGQCLLPQGATWVDVITSCFPQCNCWHKKQKQHKKWGAFMNYILIWMDGWIDR